VKIASQLAPARLGRSLAFAASKAVDGLAYAGVVLRSILPPTGVASAPVCKYHPSCSQYARDAIRKYGPLLGPPKAVWRLLRCNPWSRGGVDYV
jgi:putative membrane protein insertion efficiency factor